jgi:hypothetical protein
MQVVITRLVVASEILHEHREVNSVGAGAQPTTLNATFLAGCKHHLFELIISQLGD